MLLRYCEVKKVAELQESDDTTFPWAQDKKDWKDTYIKCKELLSPGGENTVDVYLTHLHP